MNDKNKEGKVKPPQGPEIAKPPQGQEKAKLSPNLEKTKPPQGPEKAKPPQVPEKAKLSPNLEKTKPPQVPEKAKLSPNLEKAKLPQSLKKLDLKCFPKEETPSWLEVKNLQGLTKLYIRGGKFRDLGQYQGIDNDGNESVKEWNVERLRLKYLGEIEMEWRQLQGLFPKLEYLEKVRCPNLTLFPCDAKGVWVKKN